VDVLSDMVAATRIGRPHSSRNYKHAPWGTRFEPFAGAGFHVVLQGSCWLIPAEGDAVPLAAGDVVFLPHGRGHGLADSPATSLTHPGAVSLADSGTGRENVPVTAPSEGSCPADATVLLCGGYLLDRTRSNPLLDGLPDAIHLPALTGDRRSLNATVGLLGSELERPLPGSAAVVPALLDAMLLYILRAWIDEQAGHHPVTSWAAALSDPAILAALSVIHHDPAGPWTVEMLARHAALSRAAFARRFTARVGQAPIAYLTWWRMTVAARSLRETEAPIGAIAKEIGYTSQFAFANAFKRTFGTAPGRYRRVSRHEVAASVT
jgi:AraC-like DNA-binding protein